MLLGKSIALLVETWTNIWFPSTGASNVFNTLYGFNQLQISLMFIPVGAGSITAAFSIGKGVDWNYRRYATRLGFSIVRNRGQDLTEFPIEKARLQIVMPVTVLAGAFVIA